MNASMASRGAHPWSVAIGCLLLLLGSPRDGVQAEWYLGAYGGVTIPQATGFRQPSSSVHTDFPSDLHFKDGPIAGVKLGNYFLAGGLFNNPWVGLEAEVLYAHPSFRPDTLTATSTGSSPGGFSLTAVIPPTSLAMLGGTANVMFRIPGTHVLPYVGIGVGGAHFSSADTGLGAVRSTDILLNLMIGMELKVTERVGVLVEFKHLLSNFEFQSGHNTSVFQMENVVGGVAWHF